MNFRGRHVKFTCLKQQTLSRKHMPLSNWMRPVIFPPLISDASAKWEVKSQIWDVTFGLPPCLLPPSLPTPIPSLSLVLFSTSLIWLHRPCASTWRATGCLWIGMLLAKWILYRAQLCLVWARNRNVLRNWQRGKDRAGWHNEKARLRRQ